MTYNKLYLVNPPNPLNMKGFPGSLLSLDLWIRNNCPGSNPIIIDEEDTETGLRESLEGKIVDPNEKAYFGITCTTATYQDALESARTIKQLSPSSQIILGGHHVDGQERIILENHPEIDYTVSGEGEKALEAIMKGDFNSLGISYRGNITSERGTRLTNKELNTLDISQFNLEYQSSQFEETNLVTARGCPMGCSFCAVSKDKVVSQDQDLIVSQIDYIVKNSDDSPTIAVQDNFFAQNPERAKQVARKIIEYRDRTGNQFDWNVQTRVEQFADPELPKLLSEAGCSAVYFGIENFDPRMLEILNKAHNRQNYLELTKRAISNCYENGIQPHLDMQVGIPGEDKETERINEESLREIGEYTKRNGNVPIVFPSLSVVYPATQFYYEMINSGIPNDIYELFTKWERENPEYRNMLHGYFAHGNGGIPRGLLNHEELLEGRISVKMDNLLEVKRYVDRLRNIDNVKVHDFTNPIREKG